MKIILIGCALLLSATANAQNLVKMSSSKICHDESSRSYTRTKNYTAYASIEECLDAGGRLPKGATHKTVTNDYQRDAFGHGWADSDKDCQDTRAEILIAHNVGALQMSSNQCRVVSGQWVSLFTGNKLYKASDVDIDHVLSLKRAWELGASNWSEDKREQFSNDPANLLVVEARLNRQKGAKDITQWLPPANKCQYILRNIRILTKYEFDLPSSLWQQYETLRQQHCATSA